MKAEKDTGADSQVSVYPDPSPGNYNWISDETIRELQRLWRSRYQTELSDADARELGGRLVELLGICISARSAPEKIVSSALHLNERPLRSKIKRIRGAAGTLDSGPDGGIESAR